MSVNTRSCKEVVKSCNEVVVVVCVYRRYTQYNITTYNPEQPSTCLERECGVTEKSDLSEKEVRVEFERVAGKYFLLWPEVWLRHWSNDRLRIDYIGFPMCAFPRCFVGFEIKSGMDQFNSVTNAIRQANDYRESTIIDKRFVYGQGQRPMFVFLYNPSWRHPRGLYSGWLAGAWRLAGQFKVGSVEKNAENLRLELSADRLWDNRCGPRLDGNIFGTARKIGSK